MIVFHTDLDNTIIYSYKHDIGPYKRNVEIYQEREISYVTERTYELLQQVKKEMLVVPTTTRTIEQYKRIDLDVGKFQYALVCNGGILLVDGIRDEAWYQESLERIKDSVDCLKKAMDVLEKDTRRKFELRFIEELFVFTKCNEPENVVMDLRDVLDTSLVDVFHNGEKVYVVPTMLNKGASVERLKKILHPDYVIAAGDSEFDISMVSVADKGIVPYGFKEEYHVEEQENVIEMKENILFSEAVLETCIHTKASHNCL